MYAAEAAPSASASWVSPAATRASLIRRPITTGSVCLLRRTTSGSTPVRAVHDGAGSISDAQRVVIRHRQPGRGRRAPEGVHGGCLVTDLLEQGAEVEPALGHPVVRAAGCEQVGGPLEVADS